MALTQRQITILASQMSEQQIRRHYPPGPLLDAFLTAKKAEQVARDNRRAKPGCFLVRGKAWYDEYGNMVIDEDGNVPDDIQWDLEEFGDFFYNERSFRTDGTPRAGARPVYELRWCPVAKEPKPKKPKPRKR